MIYRHTPNLSQYFYFKEAEKEASENISNICAKIKAQDIGRRLNLK